MVLLSDRPTVFMTRNWSFWETYFGLENLVVLEASVSLALGNFFCCVFDEEKLRVACWISLVVSLGSLDNSQGFWNIKKKKMTIKGNESLQKGYSHLILSLSLSCSIFHFFKWSSWSQYVVEVPATDPCSSWISWKYKYIGGSLHFKLPLHV